MPEDKLALGLQPVTNC